MKVENQALMMPAMPLSLMHRPPTTIMHQPRHPKIMPLLIHMHQKPKFTRAKVAEIPLVRKPTIPQAPALWYGKVRSVGLPWVEICSANHLS